MSRVSGWRTGIAAGISAALTLALLASMVYVYSLAKTKREQAKESERRAAQQVVSPMFRSKALSVATGIRELRTALSANKTSFLNADKHVDTEIQQLTKDASTVHEMDIAHNLWFTEFMLHDCAKNIYDIPQLGPISRCIPEASDLKIEDALH